MMSKFERWADIATQTIQGHAKAAKADVISEYDATHAAWHLGDRTCAARPSVKGTFAALLFPDGKETLTHLIAVEESAVVDGGRIFAMLNARKAEIPEVPDGADPDLVAVVDTFTRRGSDDFDYEADWAGPLEVRLRLSPQAQIIVDRKNRFRIGGAITLRWRGSDIHVVSVENGGALDLIPVIHAVIIDVLEMPSCASVDDVRRALGPLVNMRIE